MASPVWTFYKQGSWLPYGAHETVQIELAFQVCPLCTEEVRTGDSPPPLGASQSGKSNINLGPCWIDFMRYADPRCQVSDDPVLFSLCLRFLDQDGGARRQEPNAHHQGQAHHSSYSSTCPGAWYSPRCSSCLPEPLATNYIAQQLRRQLPLPLRCPLQLQHLRLRLRLRQLRCPLQLRQLLMWQR
jgi:hypothetical protein